MFKIFFESKNISRMCERIYGKYIKIKCFIKIISRKHEKWYFILLDI